MKNSQKYSQYDVEDFVSDEFFQDWVLNPTKASIEFWKIWLSEHPEKNQVVMQAQSIIMHLPMSQAKLSDQEVEAEVDLILKNLDSMLTHLPKSSASDNVVMLSGRSLLQVACLLVLVVAATFFLVKNWQPSQTYSTQYAEVKDIPLEDGSKVTLNAHSYLKTIGANQREVILQGEAYFKVEKKDDRKQFVVLTNHAQLTVVGTAFNVYERQDSVCISLESGLLDVTLGNDTITRRLTPSEVLYYNVKKNNVKLMRRENVRDYSSWKDGEYVFRDRAVTEIAKMVEDNYGKKLTFAASLKDKRISGKAPSNQLDLMLKMVAESLDAQIIALDSSRYVIQ